MWFNLVPILSLLDYSLEWTINSPKLDQWQKQGTNISNQYETLQLAILLLCCQHEIRNATEFVTHYYHPVTFKPPCILNATQIVNRKADDCSMTK